MGNTDEKIVPNTNEELKDVPATEETAEAKVEEKAEVVEKETEAKPAKVKKEKAKKEEVKESRLLKVLKEEHKWETYLLGFISCVAIGIGALILTGVLEFKPGTPVLYDYPIVVGWVFEIFGIVGLLLFIIPIFKPTKKEIKQLSLPTKTLFLGNVARVFIFITILALIFVLFESVISAVLGKLV